MTFTGEKMFSFILENEILFICFRALAHENYSSISDQTVLSCFEMICVHLRIVPSSVVREQCEQLWPRLTEFEE